MKTAAQIRKEARDEERQRRQLRERAVLTIAAAGAAATRELEAVERRKQALRDQLERDLAAEDAKLDAKELAAGQAVIEAMSGADLSAIGATFRDSELQKRTGIQLAVLRRWVRRVRETEERAPDHVERAPTSGARGSSESLGAPTTAEGGAHAVGPVGADGARPGVQDAGTE